MTAVRERPKTRPHVVPRDPADLPEDRRGSGFGNLDFASGEAGALEDGRGVAARGLPRVPDRLDPPHGPVGAREGELWAVEAAFAE